MFGSYDEATQLLDPLAACTDMHDSYVRYLKSRYAPNNVIFRQELYDALDNRFDCTKGPYLQAPPTYALGRSIRALVEAGVVHKRFLDISTDAVPPDRPLYLHQEVAIRKATERRNQVIATGTGSGKTECYLLPILDHLLREAERGTLSSPGVRALLLYPMNALANDQMDRIRELLECFPEIKFGRYIGATLRTHRQAIEQYQADYERDPDPGELISRQQMREEPPHILLTNYAMLEYLLLRPEDTAFFDGLTGKHWSFVVLDEMHIYSGARGAEIAMLLRRVKDRVNQSQLGKLCFFGTSATLGAGRDAPSQIADFSSNLFGERVEHDQDDPKRQDVVEPVLADKPTPKSTWTAPNGAFSKLRQALELEDVTMAVRDLLPTGVVRRTQPDLSALLCALRSEWHVLQLSRALRSEPLSVPEVLSDLFTDQSLDSEISDFMAVCTSAYGNHPPLVPARYHFILRALEGAFVCVSPKHPVGRPWMRLERHLTCPDCEDRGIKSVMFEFGVCVRCSAEFLVGENTSQDADGFTAVTQAPPHQRNLIYALLGDEISEDDQDESAVVDDSEVHADVDRRQLCTSCGALRDLSIRACRCGARRTSRAVTMAKPKKRSQPLRRCPACSGRSLSPIVLRFFTGHDAPASVIATALYQALPPRPGSADQLPEIGENRKLLTFSDSRQEAAFFAPYLDRTYSRAIQRRLLWAVIDSLRDDGLRLEDLEPRVRRLAEDYLVLDPDTSSASKNDQVRTWLMAEVLGTDRRQSLDGVGLAEITVAVPRRVVVPPDLLKLGFTNREVLDIVAVLLDYLRRQASVHLPTGVKIEDQMFAPRNVVTAVRAEAPAKGVMAWMPRRGRNSRLDYLTRVFERRRIREDPVRVLNGLWRWLTERNCAWRRVLTPTSVRGHGTVFRLEPEWVTVIPVSENHPAWLCSKCRQVAWRNVSDVCPSWLCDGSLTELPIAGRQTSAHYRHLYTKLAPSGMRVEEHTGQLGTDRAREIQQDFVDGRVNTLSCTTTFELGVDLGDIDAVLMRNVPPSPANYVQRAGRAGRRRGAAIITTFARRRNHDLYHFKDPIGLIAGHVEVPILSLSNPLIARRHIHAVAFAAYELRHVRSGKEAHRSVESFFTRQDERSAAVDDFVLWLQTRPAHLGDAIARIVPESVADQLGVTNWGWANDLIDDSGTAGREHHGWLTRAAKEIRGELNEIAIEIEDVNQRIQELGRRGQSYRAERLTKYQGALYRVEGTLKRKRLLDYLASRVVLPKYGFPVDVVSLDVWRAGDRGADRVDLTRDLRMAISEYAPGSQLVADRTIWESEGLRVMPGMALVARRYGSCDKCQRFDIKIAASDDDVNSSDSCPECNSTRQTRPLVIPQFGFVGRRHKDKPGDSRPPTAGWSRTYFSDYAGTAPITETVALDQSEVQLKFSRQGQITAVNRGPVDSGFFVCFSCGYAVSVVERSQARSKKRTHRRPGTLKECTGLLKYSHLGHYYLTDVIELDLMLEMEKSEALSVLYALLAASPSLGIPNQDVNGVVGPMRSSGRLPLIIFDTVPGGAGNVRRIRESVELLLKDAYRVVRDCQCASSTSCYGCLREYRNQEFHDQLSRGLAFNILNSLVA